MIEKNKIYRVGELGWFGSYGIEVFSLMMLAVVALAGVAAPFTDAAAVTTASPIATIATTTTSVKAALHITDFTARLPVHILGSQSTAPKGLTPDQIKKVYHLPATGGTGTIAIIAAYNDKELESDLGKFSKQFNLPACTVANKCLEQHLMDSSEKEVSGWSLETALDSEWAHAIAPTAHILVVEAKSDSGTALLAAIDYAKSRKDVASVSMSWGGTEFTDETKSDSHFVSDHPISFFASSGDSGYGVSWPAVSPYVIAVGGTTLSFKSDGSLNTEKAWFGSGGGVSTFESEPAFQTTFDIARANGKRAIPDVSYDADPYSGYSVFHAVAATTSKSATASSTPATKGWYVIGGTSAGAPQWAAIATLTGAGGITASKLYTDKASTDNAKYFRDIVSGSNGTCVYYCDARKRFDYVTGLGSPLTVNF